MTIKRQQQSNTRSINGAVNH